LPVELHLSLLPSNRAQLTIRDHGIGIPHDDLDFIFEPFYRVDRSRVKATGGYGLGLALVQKIIIAHRGQILVQSNTGKGSTFVIELPSDQHPTSDVERS
jgi:signal transduction histidine kinase